MRGRFHWEGVGNDGKNDAAPREEAAQRCDEIGAQLGVRSTNSAERGHSVAFFASFEGREKSFT